MGRTEAEDAIKTLVQVGFIECLSSDAHELSLYDNSQYFRMVSSSASNLECEVIKAIFFWIME